MKQAKTILTNTVLAGAFVVQSTLSDAQSTASTATLFNDAIRPFRVHVSKKDLADLRNRIKLTRWPDKESVTDQSQGVRLQQLQSLLHYWSTNYDWRKAEAKLNALPQFITSIDSVDIYFIHVRSKEKNALPVILTHGWPGSVFEFLKVIDPLTNPTAYGGKSEQAFDVIIPAIPGYGFSGKPTSAGWDPERIAKAWALLMKRLGYRYYVAQGGDWGAPISYAMARQQPEGLLGIHVNLPSTIPTEIAMALATGAPAPPGLTGQERSVYESLVTFSKKGNSVYNTMMTARPQTIGYGVMDSPAFLAAWMLGHPGFANWSYGEDSSKEPTVNEVLDNFTLYWLTQTASSAARLYWENKGRGITAAAAQKTSEINLPVAISIFPEDVYRPPLTWAKRAYKNLVYFNEVDKGGHFASWEQPLLFAEELRAAFNTVR